MKKLKMHSPDLTDENIAKIRELFPNCVTEATDENGKLRLAVDFDQLKQELSDSIVEGPQERYRLDWPGKRKALLTANAPIAKTLRPCREESVDFDTTQNLFIEGDNLDALKLLQETYLGKVKMIYIDPPYNTGKDFIYKDNFAANKQDYLEDSGQIDEEGGKLISNPESNGRYHSDWLSMMYPRLKLARNLLRDDGVIFISIADDEQANLKRLCDGVFGEDNFISQIAWHNSSRSSDFIATEHEYIIVYAKKLNDIGCWKTEREEATRIKNIIQEIKDTCGNIETAQEILKSEIEKYQDIDKRNKTKVHSWVTNYNNIDENWNIYYSVDLTGEGSGPARQFGNKLIPAPPGRHWMGQDYIDTLYKEGRIVWRGKRAYRKLYIQESKDNLKSIIKIPTRRGSECLKKLLGKDVFDKPKPHDLIKHLIKHVAGDVDVILDFFAGSSSTAHATMQLNAEDGGNRKSIMVQLPESCDAKSEAFKAGYKTIAEISKERIRRAGRKILEGEYHKDWNKDVGFRVLKIDTSNMADVYYTPEATIQGELLAAVDNIKPGRGNPEDLLFQVLVDWGVDLALPIRRETIQGKTVFFVNHAPYDLIACFDKGITEELVKELTTHKPVRVVFRDNGFVSDAVKINVDQIFRQLSPTTDVKSI